MNLANEMENYTAFRLALEKCLLPVEIVPEDGRSDSPWTVYRDEAGNWCSRGSVLATMAQTAGMSRLTALLSREDAVLVLDERKHPLGLATREAVYRYLLENAERAVAALEALLRTSNESICAIDEQGIVTMWNPQAEQRYRIPRQEIIGRNVESFFSNLLITKVQYNAMTSGKPMRDRYHQPLLGEHVLTNASPIVFDQKVWGAVTAERDITETMRLSHELARTNTQVSNLRREIDQYSRTTDAFDLLTGESPAMGEVMDMARRIANTDVSVLLRGESGTGRSLLAEAIHRSGKRHDRPFVAVHCGAIPPNLFENELFGRQGEGGEQAARQGKLEEAHTGTLFLDEVSKLPLDVQAKLLRVLQNQRFYRVGGAEPLEADVRLLSSTNQDLWQLVEQGMFREDLYYRINVVTLELPPLRERKEDVSLLAHQFLREFCLKQGIPIKHLEPEVLTYLVNYGWPGNIRELRNVLERLVALSEGNAITTEHLPGLIKYAGSHVSLDVLPDGGLQSAADRTERSMILQALESCHGDRSRAAKMLGIPRSTLYYKLNKHGIGRKK